MKVEGHRKDKLKHVDPATIIIGERFREDMGDLEELKDSIKTKGIIQPITIDSNSNLMAGGRRTQCALDLGLPTIPVIIRDSEDELDLREIELMENIYRKDFTWAERAKLTQKINELFHSKHGNGQWSNAKTADALDRGTASISRDLQLAAALNVIPELGLCKTADDALKTLKKLEDDAIVAELRKRQQTNIQNEGTANPNVVESQFKRGLRSALDLADKNYMISDVFAGLAGLRSNSRIDIIECDPPYGIDLNEQKASKSSIGSNVHSYKEVESTEYEGFLDKLTSELFRVAGKDCWLVFWYGQSWHQTVLESLRKAGWAVDEIPAVWVKPQGQTMQPEKYFARCWEPFFLCRKGNPVMIERGRSNVFQYTGVAGKNKYHPTQRPTELINDVLSTLGAGQQHVLIPFLGSGATLLSCYELGFQGFGFDLNGEYKDRFMLEVEAQVRKNYEQED